MNSDVKDAYEIRTRKFLHGSYWMWRAQVYRGGMFVDEAVAWTERGALFRARRRTRRKVKNLEVKGGVYKL